MSCRGSGADLAEPPEQPPGLMPENSKGLLDMQRKTAFKTLLQPGTVKLVINGARRAQGGPIDNAMLEPLAEAVETARP